VDYSTKLLLGAVGFNSSLSRRGGDCPVEPVLAHLFRLHHMALDK